MAQAHATDAAAKAERDRGQSSMGGPQTEGRGGGGGDKGGGVPGMAQAEAAGLVCVRAERGRSKAEACGP